MTLLLAEFSGLLLIIFFCALALSEAVERLAERWGANFTGSILLGFVTVLPEYTFVYWAVKKGQVDMALGSATGAATMLMTVGFGLVIVTATTGLSRRPVRVIQLSKTTRIDALYLFLTAVAAVCLGLLGGGLSLIDGAMLTCLFFAYVVHLYLDARKKSLQDGKDGKKPPRVTVALVVMIICAAIIVVVSDPFVDSMKELAQAIEVPPLAIAIILSPIASELPEKLTAYVTVHRRGALAEISICNFIGSVVNHNSLLLAMMPFVLALTGHEGFVSGVVVPAFWMMTSLTLFGSFSLSLGRLRLWQGLLFAALYLALIAVAVFFHQGPAATFAQHQ